MIGYLSPLETTGLFLLMLFLIGAAAFCFLRYDDSKHLRYGSGKRVEPAWPWLGNFFIVVLILTAIFAGANQEPRKTERQLVQEKVDACLEAGGFPIVTDSGTRSGTHPTYWGCKK